ncbi:MAG: hypothetical protein KAU17_10440 [Spirochaetales bacterium]|nr:hypothetical protein [Spirochaetales bacterium]
MSREPLLREANIPARFYLAQVDKAVQWGVMPPLAYRFTPEVVTHSWAEVYLNNHWIVLEGVNMDKPYFMAARRLLLESDRPIGYAIGLLCLANWRTGYLLTVILGILNLFPLVLLLFGIAPFQNRPYFNGWITLSLIYFGYRAYKSRET